jgi:hypothetical protein
VVFKVSADEEQAFHVDRSNYNVKPTEQGFEVHVPTVEVKGGPWNGDRYLVDYTADHYECVACNRMFAVQK